MVIDLSITASASPLHTSQTLAKCFPLGMNRASLTNCAREHAGFQLISANIRPLRVTEASQMAFHDYVFVSIVVFGCLLCNAKIGPIQLNGKLLINL